MRTSKARKIREGIYLARSIQMYLDEKNYGRMLWYYNMTMMMPKATIKTCMRKLGVDIL